MHRTKLTSPVAALMLALGAIPASPSVLTFDQFIDAAKTVRVPNSAAPNQAYGDNITDFSPAGAVGGRFVNYGSAGGLTPDIQVAYRWYDTLDPTNPDPDHNGPGGS